MFNELYINDYCNFNTFKMIFPTKKKTDDCANEDLLEIICNSLNSQYNPTWYNTAKEIIKQLPKDNYWYTSLAESFGLELLEKDPFEDFDTLEISEEDLPF